MTRLILTTGVSSAGRIMQSRIADRVVASMSRPAKARVSEPFALPCADPGLPVTGIRIGVIDLDAAEEGSTLLAGWSRGSLSGRCRPPIVLGVCEDGFSMALHDDKACYAAYVQRTWSLSPLGARIIAGAADLTASVPTDRWLGNIHLTRGRPWRWNAETETLIRPA